MLSVLPKFLSKFIGQLANKLAYTYIVTFVIPHKKLEYFSYFRIPVE